MAGPPSDDNIQGKKFQKFLNIRNCDRIPTVKFKIARKCMGKAGYRTSVTFKL